MEQDVAENLPTAGRVPLPPAEVRIESVGVNALDRRRVDVAVDLTPCREAVTVDMVIVGPDDEELCSSLLVDNTEWMLDKVLHLRQDAGPGRHTLHVGVFYDNLLVTRVARAFEFPTSEAVAGP
jgi:hypothetical protein